ncbi:MAG: periplasmic heavy metal sensor [Deltaproteobacteria bacterium]|nr:periplasmic heavy metal sensor [Deltaproteobacteria bacterium]
MHRTLGGMSLTLVLLASASTGWAQPGPPPAPHGGGGPGHGLLRVASQVGLSPQQLAQIRKIAFAAQRQMIPLEAQLRAARLDLWELMESDSVPSDDKVGALVEKVTRAEGQVKKQRLLMMLHIRRLMSKPQWEKLRGLLPGRGHRWMKRGPGGGHGMGPDDNF